MDYISIEVPDLNDSMSRITLGGKVYFLRFTWNMAAERWTFGVYDAMERPIAIGLKVVPNFCLNLYTVHLDLPYGVFCALTTKDTIGRNDFKDGTAEFVYIPVQ